MSFSLASALAPARALATTPGTPGTPQAGSQVFLENFENVTGSGPVGIENYTGAAAADNETYAEDPIYKSTANNCNGWIADFHTTEPTTDACIDSYATGLIWYESQYLATALGQFEGESATAAEQNHALIEFTGGGNNTGVELQTSPNTIPAVPGHFYDAQADYDVIDYVGGGNGCDFSDPKIDLYLISGATKIQVGSKLDPCTSSQTDYQFYNTTTNLIYVRVARLISSAVQWTGGATMGVEQFNETSSGGGNDGSTDNIQVVDVTPQLDKAFSPATITLGQASTLTFTITNTSELGAKDGWSFSDSLPAGVAVATPSDAMTTCSSTTVTTAAGSSSISATGDLNAGQKSCTVTVNVTSNTPGAYTNGPSNVTTTGLNPPGSTTLTAHGSPTVSIVKQASVSPVADQNAAQAGDVISYSYKVTNTGNVPLTSVSVTDPTLGPVTCPPLGSPGLAPGASTTCDATATVTVTQADVDAATPLMDTATATGMDAQGDVSPSSQPSTATVDLVAADPSLQIQKTANAANGDGTPITVGETIDYTYVVTNTGNVDMTSISVDDPTAGSVTCDSLPPAGLAPGASVGCKADKPYTVTQTDVDAGQVVDTATAAGKDPSGGGVKSTPAQAQVKGSPNPLVSVDKTATVTPSADQNAVQVGDTIAYSYVVKNIGNVDLKSVSVNDPTIGAVSCPTPGSPGLAPGGSETCKAKATHTVTQSDVDAGKVLDTATATGTDTLGNTSPQSNPSTATVLAVAPVISDSVQKSATVTPTADQNAVKAGDTIEYSYGVTNTGNVDLTAVTVTDPTGGQVTCPAPASPGLAPGASETCNAVSSYTVTQADVDAGKVVDTATSTPVGPTGEIGPISKPSTVTTTAVAPAPAVSVQKSGTVTPGTDQGGYEVGDAISYSYLVTNTGNVTLASVSVNDPSGGGVRCPTPVPPGLAPGASVTCTSNVPHIVTQADVDAVSISDTATATGTDTNGNTSPVSAPSTAKLPAVAANPRLSLQKLANASAGDTAPITTTETIQYSYFVQNTGNVTINGVAVTDSTTPTLTITCPQATLAPQQSETCAATTPYTPTLAQQGADQVTDTGTVTGTDPGGTNANATSKVTLPAATAAPATAIDKTATVSPAGDQDHIQIGDTITYTYVVTNVGNDPLTSVSVNDPTGGAVTCPPMTLAPGQSETCTGNTPHTVTQADLDAVDVKDSATSTGSDGVLTSNPSTPSTATVYSQPKPAVAVAKTAAVSPAADQGAVKVGDQITYSYVVTNTGNVDLPKIAVSDPTGGAVSCPPPAAPGLAPGASETCTSASPQTVTQAEVDGGKVVDEAYATGTDPQGTVSPPASSGATVAATPPVPAVSIKKSATVSPAADRSAIKVGDTIGYGYVVTNTGNVTLAAAQVSDPTLGAVVTCPTPAAPGFAPGASITCTTTGVHTVTQADVDAGGFTDRASAIGTDPSYPPTPTVTDTASAGSNPDPAVTVRKTARVFPAGDQKAVKVGDHILYSYKVTNVGNVDLVKIAVTDKSLGPVSCAIPPAPGLAPGRSETCVGEIEHVVSAADIRAGKVTDRATATGTDALGGSSGSSPRSTAVVDSSRGQLGRLVLTKTSSKRRPMAGHDVTYTLTVRDPTATPVMHVEVCDPLPRGLVFVKASRGHHFGSGVCWSIARLGAHATRRMTVTANVARASGGMITNHATAAARGIPAAHASASINARRAPISPCATPSRRRLGHIAC